MKKKGDLLAVRAFATYEAEAMAQYRDDWARDGVNVRTHDRVLRVDRAYLPLKVIVVRKAV